MGRKADVEMGSGLWNPFHHGDIVANTVVCYICKLLVVKEINLLFNCG